MLVGFEGTEIFMLLLSKATRRVSKWKMESSIMLLYIIANQFPLSNGLSLWWAAIGCDKASNRTAPETNSD
jgi:hypothetical protein